MTENSAASGSASVSPLLALHRKFLPFKLAFLCSLSIMILELEASRLVARHVGSSLAVWTSVIGIMLMGICLGNALGGRLADMAPPRRLIGPMLAIGSAMTIISLLINDLAGPTVAGIEALPFNMRAVLLISLDFLIPTTLLGMISPIVAKIAVENAGQKGSAIGLIYFLGAVGSIVGTFIAGYYLIFVAPTSTIVALVAGMLALLSLIVSVGETAGLVYLAAATIALIGMGSTASIIRLLGAERANPTLLSVFGPIGKEVVTISGIGISAPMLGGYVACLVLGVLGLAKLLKVMSAAKAAKAESGPVLLNAGDAAIQAELKGEKLYLTDLAVMSFMVSLAFMAFEMVAGRMVTRHLGSSIYGWTTVIGVLLGGLSVGNFLGGWLSNFTTKKGLAAFFFMLCSMTIIYALLLESPANALVNSVEWFRDHTPLLSEAVVMTGPWWKRVLKVVAINFLPASIALGTVSPMLAKIAIDRATASGKVGQSIGVVYAWGMVGSILGTFLTGFYLIDIFGTKVMMLLIAGLMAACAAVLGGVMQAAWAGLPLGLCLIALMPFAWFQKQANELGLTEPKGDPNDEESALAWIDESQYYYIKVNNEPEEDSLKRTIVLDNLIHGYFLLNHPEHIEYDYEYIYALVSQRVAEAKAKSQGLSDFKQSDLSTLFLGGGAYTFPRYMQNLYPKTKCDVAEIDPAVLKANQMAMGLPADTTIETTIGDARQFVLKNQGQNKYDLIYGDAFNDFSVPWHLTTKEFNAKLANLLSDNGVYMINIIDVYESDKVARKKAEESRSNPETELERAKGLGGFLSSWVKTARETFPHVYVYGTETEPGQGERETFVVVVSKQPIDLKELGKRPNDPKFVNNGTKFEPEPFPELNMKELDVRARGIILTDDYAPVENLLAPVAATRGD
ncbi:MAG: fused MFS/spermidine synthase [Isosphaeraceae bacterium]